MSIVIGVRTDASAATTEMEGFAKATQGAEQAANRAREANGRFMKGAASDAASLSAEIEKLTGKLAALAGVHELMHLADAFTETGNRLRVLTSSQAEFTRLMDDTFAIAQSTRMEWGEVAATYQRLTAATEDLHLSEQKRLGITRELAEGVKISGASTREAAMAMGEFMHAFETGALTGREFKVLMKDTPALMSELRHALGLTGEQFAEMGKHGELSAAKIIEAFDKAAPSIHEKFGRTIPTLTEQWQMFEQEMTKALGESGAVEAAMTAMSAATKWLGEALRSALDDLRPMLDILKRVAQAAGELTKVIGPLAKAWGYINPIGQGMKLLSAGWDLLPGGGSSLSSEQLLAKTNEYVIELKANYAAARAEANGTAAATKELDEAAEKMLKSIKDPMKDHNLQVEALNKLWADGKLSAEAYAVALNKIKDPLEEIRKLQLDEHLGDVKARLDWDARAKKTGATGYNPWTSTVGDLSTPLDKVPQIKHDARIDAIEDMRELEEADRRLTAATTENEEKMFRAYEKGIELVKKIVDDIKGPMRDFQRDVSILNSLMEAGAINTREYALEFHKLAEAAGGDLDAILNAAAGKTPEGLAGPGRGQTEAQAYAAYKQSLDAATDSEMRMLDVEADLRKRRADDQPSLEKAMAAQQQQIDLTRKWKAELIGLQNQRDFGKGIADGINAIGHEIDNVAGTIASKMLDAFHRINEALVDLITTGDIGLSKLAKALERDLAGSLVAQGESGLKQAIQGNTGDVTDSFKMTTAMSSGGATAAAEIAAAMATGGASAAAAIAAAMATGGAAAGVSGAAQPSLGDFIDDKNAAEAGGVDLGDAVERRTPRGGGRGGDPLAAVKSDRGQEVVTNIVSKQHGAALATRDRLRARS